MKLLALACYTEYAQYRTQRTANGNVSTLPQVSHESVREHLVPQLRRLDTSLPGPPLKLVLRPLLPAHSRGGADTLCNRLGLQAWLRWRNEGRIERGLCNLAAYDTYYHPPSLSLRENPKLNFPKDRTGAFVERMLNR